MPKIKKSKSTIKYVIKRNLIFEDYKNCSEATQLHNKINQLGKSSRKITKNL